MDPLRLVCKWSALPLPGLCTNLQTHIALSSWSKPPSQGRLINMGVRVCLPGSSPLGAGERLICWGSGIFRDGSRSPHPLRSQGSLCWAKRRAWDAWRMGAPGLREVGSYREWGRGGECPLSGSSRSPRPSLGARRTARRPGPPRGRVLPPPLSPTDSVHHREECG